VKEIDIIIKKGMGNNLSNPSHMVYMDLNEQLCTLVVKQRALYDYLSVCNHKA